jgi:hypothetical protein
MVYWCGVKVTAEWSYCVSTVAALPPAVETLPPRILLDERLLQVRITAA